MVKQNIETEFYYDKAPKLPDEIEHIKPDYSLYDEWVSNKLQNNGNQPTKKQMDLLLEVIEEIKGEQQ